MTTILRFAVTGMLFLGSASLVMAQDHRIRAGAFDKDGYSAYGSMQSGPYSPSGRLVRVPGSKVLPFTWEEKRHFDQSNARE